MEPLGPVAAERTEPGELVGGLDAFGHDGQAEVVGEVDDGLGHHRTGAVGSERLDEGAVQLDDVDREPVQVAERREAGAEVVDGDLDADVVEVLEDLEAGVGVVAAGHGGALTVTASQDVAREVLVGEQRAEPEELPADRDLAADPERRRVEIDGVVVDPDRHEVLVDGEHVRLTRTELRLLHVLLRKPGRVYTREQLVERVMGENAWITDRTIDVHVRAIRRKLGERADAIETIRGVGYRGRDTARA